MSVKDDTLEELEAKNAMLDALRSSKVGTYFITVDAVYVRKTYGAMWSEIPGFLDIPVTSMDLVNHFWFRPWSLS